MKLQFKHQKFQADAAKAVVDVFAGQPYLTPTYMMDKGTVIKKQKIKGVDISDPYESKIYDTAADFTGWRNERIVPELSDKLILEHLQKVQRTNQIKPSEKLEGRYNLTIEMETGVGKTYTYIKTMYELNKHYGWSKFIVVVPSIAIREGVYKSFQVTQDHFAEEYGKKIRFFIYNSAQLTEIDRFASDSAINVMIINSQAFNAKGKDARRIYMKLDEFRSRRPIDIIAKTNPILIIDEPQSVEGKQTKERLKEFCPLLTLRYSATHKSDSIYNMVYRLDAMEAYNKRLVKKIAVKGITESGSTATEGFVYLESINVSKEKNPTASIQFDCKGAKGIRQKNVTVGIGYNLYDNSGNLDEYKVGFVVKSIDGRDNSVEFLNGIKIFAGDVIGKVSEDQLRRIQIRETILSHLERERQLFHKGIKVLSLFFIDRVEKYKQYDEAGHPFNGIYADMFEEEYNDIIGSMQLRAGDDEYIRYLGAISAHDTHAGYFSVDKKGKMTDSKLSDKKQGTSDDIDAYDLIMKNKELLLDRDPKKSPVRFIFSHSALREGWDNPNVFQICTLKHSDSNTAKRQEVGRGLRLCVNQDGNRMDAQSCGDSVHEINTLTVVASESYKTFVTDLQSDIKTVLYDRPTVATSEYFKGKYVKVDDVPTLIDDEKANAIEFYLIQNGYVDMKRKVTDKYRQDVKNGTVAELPDELKPMTDGIHTLIQAVYDDSVLKDMFSDGHETKVKDNPLNENFAKKEFQALWREINHKYAYTVDFDSAELIRNAIAHIDKKLFVSELQYTTTIGRQKAEMNEYEIERGDSFTGEKTRTQTLKHAEASQIKYDLIGKIAEGTVLTRRTVSAILQGIRVDKLYMFRNNPEEFISKVIRLINEQKATMIVEHISYDTIEGEYDSSIFTAEKATQSFDKAFLAKKAIQDYVFTDGSADKSIERKFAEDLDAAEEVCVYAKLPRTFQIPTPVGNYSPDWAIAFYEGTVKHIFFIAETKGTMESLELRPIEQAKISCAKKLFNEMSTSNVVYHDVDSYRSLLSIMNSI